MCTTGGKRAVNAKEKTKRKDGIEGKYSATVILPQTTFDQRANSLKREPELQQWWNDQQIYEKTVEANTGENFILHDGPPYANGNLHIGHSLNKILKDIINKYQILRGKKVKYIPGWDCHGLPIELKVLQNMKSKERDGLTPLELRKRAANFAKEAMASQSVAFKRYGVWGDFKQPYLTLQPTYEAAQVKVFGDMMMKGNIYRGRKPVHWSPSSRTALAEAELEYPDIRVVIWTTTPWTIPANLAVAVNDELTYCIASHANVLNGAKLLLAKVKLRIRICAKYADFAANMFLCAYANMHERGSLI
ncbi:unnamed protein product [Sphagnum jensenii]|uniref:Aminoacyl-tRNA synthetase class Ia domain-containing protein n=1 Tax=Sphagnum jensenii TaxID=128206 RepID=A0ABP0VH66_9BRYO